MKANVGNLDRAVRGLAGIVLIAVYLFNLLSGIPGIVALVAGIALLGTAVFRFCPPYALLGINTCGSAGKTES